MKGGYEFPLGCKERVKGVKLWGECRERRHGAGRGFPS